MFQSGTRFDLSAFPFSGRDAQFAIREDETTRELYLYFHRSSQPVTERESTHRIVPVIDNKEDANWHYKVEDGVMTLISTKGYVQFCFQNGNLLRLHGQNMTLRLVCNDLKIYENAAPREDGSLEMSFEVMGKYLLKPLQGSLWHDAKWIHTDIRTKEYTVELLPDATGVFDMALHEYYDNGEADPFYPSFDEVTSDAKKAIQAFAKKIGAATALEKKAAYALYTLHMPQCGHMEAAGIYSAKKGYTLSVAWQQAIAAVACSADTKLCYETLMAPFSKQDASGQIPNAVNANWVDYVTAGAPFQGIVVCYLLDRGITFTKAQAKTMYSAFKAYGEWFVRERCIDGLHPCYFHPEECGFLDATIFKWGVPVQSADLYASLALLFEACSRLAKIAGLQDRSMETSQTLIANMYSLWQNGRFLCKNTRTGHTFASGSILCLLPIILGNRLDQAVLDILIADLCDTQTFRSNSGILSENPSSKEFSLSPEAQLLGGIQPAVQWMIASGLLHARKAKLARELAQDVLSHAEVWGLLSALPPYANNPWDGKALLQENAWQTDTLQNRKNLLRNIHKEPKTAFVWSAVGAAGILALAKLIRKNSEKENIL